MAEPTSKSIAPVRPSVRTPAAPPFSALPPAQGLYDPADEKDSCGVAFLADLKGRASHSIVAQALTALHNLDHRGAAGAEPSSGDGAGITVALPDAFLRTVVPFELPAAGRVRGRLRVPAAGRRPRRLASRSLVEARRAPRRGWSSSAGASVPTDRRRPRADGAQRHARASSSCSSPAPAAERGIVLERLAFCARKVAEHRAREAGRRAVLLVAVRAHARLQGHADDRPAGDVLPRPHRPAFASAIALVHSRFSTNTFPSWPLAHPYRYIAHNGEINTDQRQPQLDAVAPGAARERPDPGRPAAGCSRSARPGASDSASFDEVLELLHLGGRSLPHAVLMMVPEAWENAADMPADAARVLPVPRLADGAVGRAGLRSPSPTAPIVGAILDRNGLRPGRWWHTSDDLVVLASEAGVLDIDPAKIVAKGRLQPGRMFLVDTARGEIVPNRTVKDELAAAQPYAEWLHAGLIELDDLPEREHVVFSHESVTRRQQVFGYTEEELRVLLAPMATAGAEPIGSMGTDTPLAALSQKPRLLFDYFTELFAQVTNPPLDAIREELVTSLSGHDRARGQPARARAGVVPAGRAAPPGDRQRRAGQDLAHQRRRRHAGPGRAR